LLTGVLRPWSVIRVVATVAAIVLAVRGAETAALSAGLTGELIGRWLFYVSVVPMNMAGSFFREGR
jgi:DMSO reductase anchor subunit